MAVKQKVNETVEKLTDWRYGKPVTVFQSTRTVLARDDRYGPKPKSGVQALIQAHAMLTEEGQWVSGSWFEDGDPEEAYEASACGSWKACTVGALGLVTGEMPVTVIKRWEPESDKDHRFRWVEDVRFNGSDLGFAEWKKLNPPVELNAEFSFPDFGIDADVSPLTAKAAVLLAKVIDADVDDEDRVDYRLDPDEAIQTCIQNNDAGTGDGHRTQVLDDMVEAIRKAGKEPLVDHRKLAAAAKRKRAKEKAERQRLQQIANAEAAANAKREAKNERARERRAAAKAAK